MRKTLEVLETISQWSGVVTCWFCLALVLLLTFEVFMRYVLDSPTIYSYEISTMMGVTIGAGGLAYTHLHGGHVRVDVFWRHLTPRGRALADIIFSLFFFFPLIIAITYVCARWLQFSVSTHEIMTKTYLYPPAWPVRAVITLGFLVFIPQGVAKLLRDVYTLKGIQLKGIEKL
ncbi:MAG: TRAP transporter small permease subunit [Chloroflexota bacterium]